MVFACIFEAISFVPGLNVLSTIIQWAVVVFVFHVKGFSYIGNAKLMATSGIAVVIGCIPVVSALPEFIIALAINIHEANKNAKASVEMQADIEVNGKPNRITRNVGQNATGTQVNFRSNQIEREFSSRVENERPQRSIQFAKTYDPVIPRKSQEKPSDRVLSASGAILKNEERNI